jgi:hypothetical protein
LRHDHRTFKIMCVGMTTKHVCIPEMTYTNVIPAKSENSGIREYVVDFLHLQSGVNVKY